MVRVPNYKKNTKVTRRQMAQLFPIGALDLWLLVRFEITEECKAFDFTNNDSWFNVKILSSTQVKTEDWGEWFSNLYLLYNNIFFL